MPSYLCAGIDLRECPASLPVVDGVITACEGSLPRINYFLHRAVLLVVSRDAYLFALVDANLFRCYRAVNQWRSYHQFHL